MDTSEHGTLADSFITSAWPRAWPREVAWMSGWKTKKGGSQNSKQRELLDHLCYPRSLTVTVVQLLSRVRLFVTPWTAACQASLSFTISRNLLKFMSIESVMPSNAISCSAALFSFCLQSFPASGSFPMSQLFISCGQSIGVSASTSVLPMNIQSWFPLRLTGLISLQSKGLPPLFLVLLDPHSSPEVVDGGDTHPGW